VTLNLNPVGLAHFTDWVTTLPLRPLPRTVTPLAGEYHLDYIARLAAANHLEFGELTGALDDTAAITLHSPRGWKQHEQERLAAAAGQSLARIARLWWPDPRVYLGDPEGFRRMLRPACRRCTARVGITEPVACHLPPHQTVCRRHRLWIGPAARSHAAQLDVSQLPEVLYAQRCHTALSHHPDWRRADAAISDAAHTIHRTLRDRGWTPHQQQRLHQLGPGTWASAAPTPRWPGDGLGSVAIEIAIYPDIIRLATYSLRAQKERARPMSPALPSRHSQRADWPEPAPARNKEHQMTSNARAGTRILGSLRSEDGTGVVRMENRFDTDIGHVWSALTDPSRLARWYGDVEGDLRPGGEFRARVTGAGEATGRVDACEPPRRLLLTMRDADPQPGQPDQTVIEATLASGGGQTILVAEERGVPLDLLAAYGAGVQIHVENLAAHLTGRELGDADARWDELLPAYQDLAGNPVWQAERATLMTFLRAQRRSVLAIIEGLSDDQIRHAVVPSGWTPLGLIEHLGGAEFFWFQMVLAGQAAPVGPPGEDDNEGGPFVAAEPLAEVVAFYQEQCEASDEVLARTALTARPSGQVAAHMADEICTARDIILHMIEETARHAGHLDLARELIDGRTGLGPR